MHKLMEYDIGLVIVHFIAGVREENVVPDLRATSSEWKLCWMRGIVPKGWTEEYVRCSGDIKGRQRADAASKVGVYRQKLVYMNSFGVNAGEMRRLKEVRFWLKKR